MMISMNALDDIITMTRERVLERKESIPAEKIREMAERSVTGNGFPFEDALTGKDVAFICEIKSASPNAGIIMENFDHLQIAEEYHTAGAAAISVVTEPHYFNGDDLYLMTVSCAVPIPVMRRDFIIDSYMIYEAKLLGASAVLLMASIVENDELAEYVRIADDLGLSSLVEVHNERDVKAALDAGARMIAVNNRDLGTMKTDISRSERLRSMIPADVLFVSKGGIRTSEDVDRMRRIGANAVMVGETLLKSPDKTKELKRLRGDKTD
jgi:indole-3-glycerol phosphate synthase